MDRARTQAGFTLIEASISVLVFVSILGGIFGALSTSTSTVQSTAVPNDLERRAWRILRRIEDAVVAAGLQTLIPAPTGPLGSRDLRFQRSVDYANGLMEWGPVLEIALEPETGETFDGQDEDGDGLVDEGRIVWRRDPGGPDEQEETWIKGVRRFQPGETDDDQDENGNGLVDEEGLSFSLSGSALTIRLCLERRTSDGTVVSRAVETTVRLRNP